MRRSPELGLGSQFSTKAEDGRHQSEDLDLAIGPAGGVSARLDIQGRAGRPSVGAEFVGDTEVEQTAFEPVGQPPELDGENQVSIYKQELRNEVERLTGGLEVLEGGQKKKVLRLTKEAKSVVDTQIVNIIKSWEVNKSGGRKANVWPEAYYVVSRADAEKLKKKIEDAPAGADCELVEFEGGFVARLGGEERPVVFITSGRGSLAEQDDHVERLAA